MRRLPMIVLAGALAVSLLTPTDALARNPNRRPGGIRAFFIGCCLGVREGTMWNEGADLHWREWAVLIPYAGIVFMIWNGIDCASGLTSAQWAELNAASWY